MKNGWVRSTVFGSSSPGGVPSSVIAVLSAALITLLFVASSDRFHHWFVIPVFVCGALAGGDAVDWFRRRTDLFDPVGILGLLITYNMFVAPLLHVKWDVWMWEVAPPSDWRDWLGRMAAINIVAMLAYLASRKFFSRAGNPRPMSLWRPDPKLFWITGVLLLCFTAALQIWIFHRHGGILGYIEDFRDPDAHYKFDGMGSVYMIAESFPVLLGLLLIVYRTRRPMKQPWLLWATVLLIIFASRIVSGGLRGSRLSIVMSVFWMAGAIHLMVRPIPRRLFAVGVVCIVAFMYGFLTYKHGGDLDKLFTAEERDRINDIHHTSLEGVLLGDLGRADVQAYLLYKLRSDPQEIKYAYGSTYLAAASITVPRILLPVADRPTDKTVYGADYIYGPGSYVPDVIWSSRIYGLAGEAMMNFSPLFIPVAFLFLGFVVGWLRCFTLSLQPGDVRRFLVPLGVYICLWMYVSDADNVISQFFLYGLVPLVFITATARRLPTGILMPHKARAGRYIHQAVS